MFGFLSHSDSLLCWSSWTTLGPKIAEGEVVRCGECRLSGYAGDDPEYIKCPFWYTWRAVRDYVEQNLYHVSSRLDTVFPYSIFADPANWKCFAT